jgi:hypothetical protein
MGGLSRWIVGSVMVTLLDGGAAEALCLQGRWEGRTSQNLPIAFEIDETNTVRRLELTYRIFGSGCTLTITTSAAVAYNIDFDGQLTAHLVVNFGPLFDQYSAI